MTDDIISVTVFVAIWSIFALFALGIPIVVLIALIIG